MSIDRLRSLIGDVMDLRHAADLIEWDERVCMPPGGQAVHGEMSAALRRLAHDMFTAAPVGEALEAAVAFERRELSAGMERDVRALLDPPDEIARHALRQAVGAHQYVDPAATAGQEHRGLARGVAASDDHHVVPLELAGRADRGAVVDAVADEVLQCGDPEAAVVHAGGDDHRAGPDVTAGGIFGDLLRLTSSLGGAT